MTATHLQVTESWSACSAAFSHRIRYAAHASESVRVSAAFDRQATDALALLADCWPEPEHDDDVTRCGACGVLWTPTRVCGGIR
jgi:hypothetical protein